MTILVTDGDTRAALAVTRSLGRAGHEVHVAAPVRRSLAGSSRYASGEHLQAGVDLGPEALGRSLSLIVGQLRPRLVVGVTDRTLTVLHAMADALPRDAMPPPSAAAYANASDKVRLFETCRQHGIAVPDGIVSPGGALPPPETLAPLGWPVVVRPALSWRVEGSRWVKGQVSYAPDLGSLAARLRGDPALAFPFLVQRRLDGEGCGLFIVADEGRIVTTFAHRRLREKPPSGGVSTLCESVAPAADLVDAAETFARALNWSGLAMLEFKRSRQDGRAHLLEVNARPWGSMELALASGVDFPAAWIDVATHRAPTPAPPYREGIRLRWFWGDVDHFYLREKDVGRSGALAMLRAAGRALVARPRPDASDTFRRDDPLPFVSETSSWLQGTR